MATLQDCMQEVVDLGTGFFVHSDAPGAYRPSQWESVALLANMQAESPGVLRDPAWTEWTVLPNGSKTCSINYGVFGRSMSHRDVPGYGHLRAFEASQKRPEQASTLGKSFDRMLGY
jgi:hypothetical protein